MTIARLQQTLLCAFLGLALGCSPEPVSSANKPAGAPVRVLPTNASAVDFVFDLIAPERVVAVPDTVADYATVALDLSHWKGERVFSKFSAESLLAFNPDLVVVSPWQDQNTIDRLLESGIQVVELPRISKLEDIRRAIREVGVAVHAEDRARALIADFDKRMAALQLAAKGRGSIEGLVYTNYGSGGWAAGSGTTAQHMMELAGVKNSAALAGRKGHDMVSIEELLTMNPDVLIISKPSRDYGVTRTYLEEEQALTGLEAIAQGRIAELPAKLFSTSSHHLLDAAEALTEELDAMIASGVLEAGDKRPSDSK